MAPRHVGSSRTRARTRVPCIGRRILNQCVAREAPTCTCEISLIFFFFQPRCPGLGNPSRTGGFPYCPLVSGWYYPFPQVTFGSLSALGPSGDLTLHRWLFLRALPSLVFELSNSWVTCPTQGNKNVFFCHNLSSSRKAQLSFIVIDVFDQFFKWPLLSLSLF